MADMILSSSEIQKEEIRKMKTQIEVCMPFSFVIVMQRLSMIVWI